jgi:hypothetical protein
MATGKDAVLTMLALDMCYVMGNGHMFFFCLLFCPFYFQFFFFKSAFALTSVDLFFILWVMHIM